MELDKIVVLVMAIGFFGGLGYLAWKGQQEQKSSQKTPSVVPDEVKGDLSNKSRQKDRRITKS